MIFRNSSIQDNSVDATIDKGFGFLPGFWPLFDENSRSTDFIAVGNKNGVPYELLNVFKEKYGNRFKYVYNCQNGPALVKDYTIIESIFDGIFDTDYKVSSSKRLNCNHSMMVRSFPCDDLFWEPIACNKEYDFNMLTVAKPGISSKRWDRGEPVCFGLCELGFKGAVYAQVGNPESLITPRLRKHVNSGALVVKPGKFTSEDFHAEACKSLITIFPNNIDAFPKFIIESLLADRPVVISDDLLLGRRYLNDIGFPVVTEMDFSRFNFVTVSKLMVSARSGLLKDVSPRAKWLKSNDFKSVSKSWASEFNRLFGTSFSQLYFMNHVPRIERCYKDWNMKKSTFFDV